jgi:hypothetical protein
LVSLAESAIFSALGAELDLGWDAATLFGEGPGQAVVACAPARAGLVHELAVPSREIGRVGGTSLLGLELEELASVYADGLAKVMAS